MQKIFAPLYCNDNGRPNFPVNILLSLEIIKNLFAYTDQELMEQFYFNYQVLYAVGIENIGEVYFAERTLYEFRERIVNYIKEHPDEEGLLFEQFEKLTKHFIDTARIKTHEQRMDSTLLTNRLDTIRKQSDLEDMYVDGGYYSEDVVKKAHEKGVKLHYTDMTGKKPLVNKLPYSAFKISEDLKIEECPNGKTPIRSEYVKRSKAITTHFAKTDCENCELRDQCPVKPQVKHMVLRISTKALTAAKARQEITNAEIHRENVSKRAAIEGTNSALKRAQGANKLRVRNKVRCRVEISLKIIGYNFKQLFHSFIKKLKNKPQGELCPILN